MQRKEGERKKKEGGGRKGRIFAPRRSVLTVNFPLLPGLHCTMFFSRVRTIRNSSEIGMSLEMEWTASENCQFSIRDLRERIPYEIIFETN